MVSTVLLLLKSSMVLSLHLAGGTGSFPRPLTREEEQDCLTRMAEGDEEARSTLIEHNMRLVAHIIKKYYTADADRDDLISIGSIGLIKGVTSYDPTKKVRLATYAARCIENEILMYFRSRRKLQGEVSLSDALDTDGDGNDLSVMDVIGVEDTMAEDLAALEEQVQVHRLIRLCLTDREADIVRRRYGIGGIPQETQRQLAERYGISRSYVSRIEKRALCKLEEALLEEGVP